ncbi:charged multivesicular body protein 6-A [Thecamonas trahens ATCC 50062]|uniref:Charged multivesicular body protein 6-A n=1 Tax=Thecamonas trahens ATCC 50062 TaxID=461836 RepID=A0A0L0DCN2_THETB|nr:charged multivesicular body protein 6-A [Thecamonas trahens ATCC 50062]KNC50074.1 charged multivesicular body protein 6-A [Thecamonas trahens ATCC 50062]|eukprot:XP_013757238.1 charged multivesicular body protein 6-A [Thecamonas trahens ATCC 50062]
MKRMAGGMDGSYLRSLPEWADDDDEMDFYYASFPASREVKPVSWDAKMAFWTRVIEGSAATARLVALRPCELAVAVERDGVPPAGLGIVFDSLVRTGAWLKAAEVAPPRAVGGGGGVGSPPRRLGGSTAAGSTLSWLVDTFVASPIKWAAGVSSPRPGAAAVGAASSLLSSDDEYVVVALARKAVDALLDAHYDAGLVDELTRVEDAAAVLGMDARQLSLALGCVAQSGEGQSAFVRFALPSGTACIKFAPSREASSRVEATEADAGTLQLRAMAGALRAQYDTLSARVEALTGEIKAMLGTGARERAKIMLRRKKVAEKLATSRLAAWDKVSAILDSMDDARTSAELMEAYKVGTRALAALSPDVDDVHETLGELEDALANQAEIDAAIADSNASVAAAGVEVSDDELAAELEALILGEVEPDAAAQSQVQVQPQSMDSPQLPDMPAVPSTPLPAAATAADADADADADAAADAELARMLALA